MTDEELREELLQEHKVSFVWVKGHAGVDKNERCDALAVAAVEYYKEKN